MKSNVTWWRRRDFRQYIVDSNRTLTFPQMSLMEMSPWLNYNNSHRQLVRAKGRVRWRRMQTFTFRDVGSKSFFGKKTTTTTTTTTKQNKTKKNKKKKNKKNKKQNKTKKTTTKKTLQQLQLSFLYHVRIEIIFLYCELSSNKTWCWRADWWLRSNYSRRRSRIELIFASVRLEIFFLYCVLSSNNAWVVGQTANYYLQSTLVISNSKGLTETLRDIRTST